MYHGYEIHRQQLAGDGRARGGREGESGRRPAGGGQRKQCKVDKVATGGVFKYWAVSSTGLFGFSPLTHDPRTPHQYIFNFPCIVSDSGPVWGSGHRKGRTVSPTVVPSPFQRPGSHLWEGPHVAPSYSSLARLTSAQGLPTCAGNLTDKLGQRGFV